MVSVHSLPFDTRVIVQCSEDVRAPVPTLPGVGHASLSNNDACTVVFC